MPAHDCHAERRQLFSVLVLLLLPSVAVAGRVGEIIIKVDDKVVLRGNTFDNGSTPAATVWRCLASNELQPAAGVQIPADPADPLRATLQGKIEIDVRYGGKAEVKELRLVRASATAGWTAHAEDIERIGWDIGLRDEVVPPPDPPRSPGKRPPSAGKVETGSPVAALPIIWILIIAGLLILGVFVLLLIVLLKLLAIARGNPS